MDSKKVKNIMFSLGADLCKIAAIPIPTNESQWDIKSERWRSIVSQKHAAQAAGLLGSCIWRQ